MSRGLSLKHRRNKRSLTPQQEGEKACGEGKPRSANPYHGSGRGKAHAWEKGWNNEHTKRCNAAYHGDIDGDFGYW